MQNLISPPAIVKALVVATAIAPATTFDPIRSFFTELDDADAIQRDRDQALYLEIHHDDFEDMTAAESDKFDREVWS